MVIDGVIKLDSHLSSVSARKVNVLLYVIIQCH